MTEEPDSDRLRALEERIAAARKPDTREARSMRAIGQGEAAWRMVIELVTGMALGLAIGYGLDVLLGTRPAMMVVFVLLGFAAGVRTMLKTAKDLTRRMQDGEDPPPGDKGQP
ncbi:MAG: AtpZ/AtpI family protein [Gemmobacter sp.]